MESSCGEGVSPNIHATACSTRNASRPSDGLEALRVEQAVAWMFGLTMSPQLDPTHPTNTDTPN